MRKFCFDNTGFLLLAWFILFMLMDNCSICFAELIKLPAPGSFPASFPTTIPSTEEIIIPTPKAPPPQAESNAQILSISNPPHRRLFAATR